MYMEGEIDKEAIRNVPSRNRSMEERTPLPEDILKALAIKYNKPTHVIEFILREEFRQIRELGKRVDMPKVLLHNLGSFQVSKKQKQTILYYMDRAARRKEAEKKKNGEGNDTGIYQSDTENISNAETTS